METKKKNREQKSLEEPNRKRELKYYTGKDIIIPKIKIYSNIVEEFFISVITQKQQQREDLRKLFISKIIVIFKGIIDSIKIKDKIGFFLHPVDTDYYKEIIDKPICISDISSNLDKEIYGSLDDSLEIIDCKLHRFENDVELIFDNSFKFNEGHEEFCKYTYSIKKHTANEFDGKCKELHHSIFSGFLKAIEGFIGNVTSTTFDNRVSSKVKEIFAILNRDVVVRNQFPQCPQFQIDLLYCIFATLHFNDQEDNLNNFLSKVKDMCYNIIDQFSDLDPNGLFKYPVKDYSSISDYNKYLEKVKYPMDFSTIRTKVSNNEYRIPLNLNLFLRDIIVVFDNAILYNTKLSIATVLATDLKNRISNIYKTSCEELIKNIVSGFRRIIRKSDEDRQEIKCNNHFVTPTTAHLDKSTTITTTETEEDGNDTIIKDDDLTFEIPRLINTNEVINLFFRKSIEVINEETKLYGSIVNNNKDELNNMGNEFARQEEKLKNKGKEVLLSASAVQNSLKDKEIIISSELYKLDSDKITLQKDIQTKQDELGIEEQQHQQENKSILLEKLKIEDIFNNQLKELDDRKITKDDKLLLTRDDILELEEKLRRKREEESILLLDLKEIEMKKFDLKRDSKLFQQKFENKIIRLKNSLEETKQLKLRSSNEDIQQFKYLTEETMKRKKDLDDLKDELKCFESVRNFIENIVSSIPMTSCNNNCSECENNREELKLLDETFKNKNKKYLQLLALETEKCKIEFNSVHEKENSLLSTYLKSNELEESDNNLLTDSKKERSIALMKLIEKNEQMDRHLQQSRLNHLNKRWIGMVTLKSEIELLVTKKKNERNSSSCNNKNNCNNNEETSKSFIYDLKKMIEEEDQSLLQILSFQNIDDVPQLEIMKEIISDNDQQQPQQQQQQEMIIWSNPQNNKKRRVESDDENL